MKQKCGSIQPCVFCLSASFFMQTPIFHPFCLRKKLHSLPSEYKKAHNFLQCILALIGELVGSKQTMTLSETNLEFAFLTIHVLS